MLSETLIKKLNALPLEAQRRVLDFITWMEARYRASRKAQLRRKLTDEPFIGLWSEREDLKDSRRWVRQIRAVEWGTSQ